MQALGNDLDRGPRGRRRERLVTVLLFGAALLVLPSLGSAQGPHVATDLRPFLIAAIDAPDGRAAGTLAGPLAEVLRSRGISSAPLRVEVTTLRAYREPGCKRLNVHFRQREVKLGDAPPTDRELAFQLNYCRDGQPPRRLE